MVLDPFGIENWLDSGIALRAQFEFLDDCMRNDRRLSADDCFQDTEPSGFSEVGKWTCVEYERG